MIITKRSALVFILLTSLVAGCSEKKEASWNKDKKPAAAAVFVPGATVSPEMALGVIRRYNQILSEGYKTLNMNPLQEVATPDLAQKAYYHMSALGEGNTRMYSELKKVDVTSSELSKPPKYSVSTKEFWDFSYVDIKTGAKSNEVKDYVYEVRYQLEDQKGRLIITDITATGEDRKEMPSWKTMNKEMRTHVPK